MATLAGLVQSLPAELYNEIYELTFTKTSTVVQVDKGYRPPSTLHVNRATRNKFSESYFAQDCIFYIKQTVLYKWMAAVANGRVQSEIRITDKLFKAAYFIVATSLFHGIAGEVQRQHDLIESLPSTYKYKLYHSHLRFAVVFGKPQKRIWVALEDVAVIHRSIDVGAEEWCERFYARQAGHRG